MPGVRYKPVLLAILAILAVAVAAATLNSAVSTNGGLGSGPGGDASDGPGIGPGAGDNASSFNPIPDLGSFGDIQLPCFPILAEPSFLAGVGAILVGAGYLTYRRIGALGPIGLLGAIGPPGILIYLLLTTCLRDYERPVLNTDGNLSLLTGNSSIGLLGGGAEGGGTPTSSVFVLAVLGLALVAAVVMYFQSSDDVEPAAGPTDEESTPEWMAAIGRAAGRAADRIEDDADLDNAVYEAWREMTTYLDVDNPTSSTPAEFATAAIDAGMNREDVTELTGVFEEVRYGGRDPTPAREEQAVAALRRIETEYGEGME